MSSSSSTVTPTHVSHGSSSNSTVSPRNNPYNRNGLNSSSGGRNGLHSQYPSQHPPESGIPVTPAVLRSIFASSRTTLEERTISRVAFFRFAGFLLSCLGISLAAARGRGMKSAAALGLA